MTHANTYKFLVAHVLVIVYYFACEKNTTSCDLYCLLIPDVIITTYIKWRNENVHNRQIIVHDILGAAKW